MSFYKGIRVFHTHKKALNHELRQDTIEPSSKPLATAAESLAPHAARP